jgi:hypothetical protein
VVRRLVLSPVLPTVALEAAFDRTEYGKLSGVYHAVRHGMGTTRALTPALSQSWERTDVPTMRRAVRDFARAFEEVFEARVSTGAQSPHPGPLPEGPGESGTQQPCKDIEPGFA